MSVVADFLPVFIRRIAQCECTTVIRDATMTTNMQLEITFDVIA